MNVEAHTAVTCAVRLH